MLSRERIEWIDYLKAIGIILVSFGHILGSLSKDIYTNNLLLICYSIELPIFFLLSGLQIKLFKKNASITLVDFIKKRSKRILWPFFTMSLVYIGLDLFIVLCKLLIINVNKISLVYYDVIDTFTLWGVGALWFLPVLFLVEIICYILLYDYENIPVNIRCVKISVFVMLSFLGIHLGAALEYKYEAFLLHDASIIDYTLCHMSRVLVASSFSLIGYFMTLPVVKAISYMQEVKVRKILTGGATLLVILGCYIATLNDLIVDLHFGYVRNSFITYPTAIMLFIGLAMLCSHISRNRLMLFVGRNSMTIMGLQLLTGHLAKVSERLISKFDITVFPTLEGFALLILFMLMAVWLCRLINQKLQWLINY